MSHNALITIMAFAAGSAATIAGILIGTMIQDFRSHRARQRATGARDAARGRADQAERSVWSAPVRQLPERVNGH